MRVKLLIFLAFILCPCYLLASLRITEIMTCNLSSYLDSVSWNFPRYLELYNSDTIDVSLKGCVIDHYKRTSKGNLKNKWEWNITDDIVVPAQSYKLLFFGGDSLNPSYFSGKIDSDGGRVVLYRGDEQIDMFDYPGMVAHLSYGVDVLNNVGYMVPSPMNDNSEAFQSLDDRTKSVNFENASPGLQNAPVTLNLSCESEFSKIYYTLDGSQPTINSLLYDPSDSLILSSTTCVKAFAISDGHLPSEILCGTFIFMDQKHENCGGFTLPIVSISLNDEYYNDDTIGIAVKGKNGIIGNCQNTPANFNQDWKRYAMFEYFVDGQQVLSEDVEVSISGGCTRSYTNIPKSLNIKTGKKIGYDKELFDYPFFDEKNNFRYGAVKIRGGGNAGDAFPLRFRDGFFHILAQEMNVDYQAYKPVAYYLNGVYQGMMGLREHLNEGYFFSNFGVEEDDIDIIKLQEVKSGDNLAYETMLDFFRNENPSDADFYKRASQMMDMEEYIDYMIIEQFSANADWPGNNIMCWRDKHNGKFRWVLYDLDVTLGWGQGDVTVDPIKWCTGDVENPTWANDDEWKTLIFSKLIKNSQFKERYLNRWLMYLGTTLRYENVESVFDSISSVVQSEYCATFDGVSRMKDGRSFLLNNARERINTIVSSLKSYYNLHKQVTISFMANIDGVRFKMNDELVNKEKYFTYYYLAKEIKLEAYPPSGYRFNRWELSFSDTTYSVYDKVLNKKISNRCKITAYFDPEECVIPSIVINELCASADSLNGDAIDDYGLYPDWIELYNYGSDTLDLSGLYLTDDMSDLTKFQIPLSFESTKIAPQSYYMFWADGVTYRGATHLNFKLKNEKNAKLAIVKICKDTMLVDSVSYKKMSVNGSYGRISDAHESWQLFMPSSDSLSSENTYYATPWVANGSLYNSVDTEPAIVSDVPLICFDDEIEDNLYMDGDMYTVFDITGKLIRKSSVWKNITSGLRGIFYVCVYQGSLLKQTLRVCIR